MPEEVAAMGAAGRQQAGSGNNFKGYYPAWPFYQPVRTYGAYSKPFNRKNRQ
jgi:hypothetical protein